MEGQRPECGKLTRISHRLTGEARGEKSGLRACALPGDFVLPAGEALAEISGLSYITRSLLCKPPIGSQNAFCEGPGRRAEFRRMDTRGWAVSMPAHGASGGLKSSGGRGGTWASRRLRRSVFSVLFMRSSLTDRPRFTDETTGWKGADPPSLGVIHESADCGTAIGRGPVRSFALTIAD